MSAVNAPAAPRASQDKPARLPRLLANTGWNVAGQLLPLVAGILVLPLLIRTLGLDRYGFLTLVWVLVGYASIFDFGISRVLVRVMALRLSRGDVKGAHHIGRVGLSFLAGLGMLIALLFALGSPWLVIHIFKLPPELLGEALNAMWLLALSIPLVMLTSGYAGVITAYEQFRNLNILRALMGLAAYIGPLMVALVVNRLDALVAVTLLLRVAGSVAHAVVAHRACGFSFPLTRPDRAATKELFSLGGWISVSNVVGPMLSYLDRLLLGALVPMRMVAFYATPFDLVNRATIVPQSLMTALFPRVASIEPGSDHAWNMLTTTARLLYLLTLPVVFALMVLAQPGLALWLGPEFAAHGAPVMQLLVVGVFFNVLAQSPATLIQAAGQPKVMALLHVVELPLFVGLLYVLTSRYGIVGTAIASLLRNGLDGLAVLVLALRDLPRRGLPWSRVAQMMVLAAALFVCALVPTSPLHALFMLAAGLTSFTFIAWRWLLVADERIRLMRLIGVAA